MYKRQLLEGQRNVMIGIDDDKIVYVPFAKAIKNDKPIDRELVNVLHRTSLFSFILSQPQSG